jgi:alkanesulfonate monooxygenase SsuD/methylene tetrahydromethanopterin reductase-like flavin-dependent oxidoreductase (luciferase family)
MELGLHIADFTWTGGAPVLGRTLARHARKAEAAGITRITVMDHFWQIRGAARTRLSRPLPDLSRFVAISS